MATYTYGQPQGAGQASIIVVPVSGEMGAMTYPVAAGNTVLLIDWSNKTFWLKSTDFNGVPQAMRVFQFEEVTPAPQAQENADVKALQGEIAEMKAMLAELAAKGAKAK